MSARPGARVLAALAVFLAAGLCACGKASPERPNALLITLDTTRADALSAYGVHPGVTPALDRLAGEGVLFERAYTTVPITLPAHASMLTGLYPPRHTVRDNGIAALPPDARTVAEAAREAGYSTAAFVAAVVLHSDFGLDQGFDTYDLPPRPAAGTETNHPAERPAREVVQAALAWLEARERGKPFFLWVHLYDAHGPYEPPPAYRRGPWGDDPYLGEVASMDHEIGRLLDALRDDGTFERTFVLVVGDHGEAFGEHGEVGHGVYCYEPTLRVPLIVRPPERTRAGERVASLVSVVDVYPTLLAGMGLAGDAEVDGRSLLAGAVDGRGLYFESYYGYLSFCWSPLAGWLDAGGKYLASSEPQFFDVAADPAEAHDGIATLADPERYRRAIATVFAASALAPADPAGLDAHAAELQSLGYAGATSAGGELPNPLAPIDLPSPQSRSDVLPRTVRAIELINRGELDQAEELYDSILAENPRNWFVLEKLATLQMQARRPLDAIGTLDRLISAGQTRAPNWFKLGVCYRAVGRDEDALKALRLAVEGSRGRAMFVGELVRLLRDLGRDDEATEVEQRYAEENDG